MTGCQWLALVAMFWFPLSMWVAIICGRVFKRIDTDRDRD